LGAARAKAGISIEKAAADTRISVQRLLELEADDFSGFPHPTYSRLFLIDYAEYLGLPRDEIRPLLPDRAGPAPGGFQYIVALSANLPAMAKSSRRRRLRLFVVLGTAVLFVLLLTAGILTCFTIKKIERVARSKPVAELTAPPEAAPQPAPSAIVLPPPDDSFVAPSEPEPDATATPPATPTP